METNHLNPLSKHFRKPAIYLRLPSNGRYWESGLTMPENREIPVYPMTAKDEITLRTPDALLNGQGVIDVIQSCCPSITDAWRMPSVDVDATLIAIRIASYGTEMDFKTTCPHCKNVDERAIDLVRVLDTVKMADYSQEVSADDVVIKLRPQEYFSLNATNQIKFEEQRLLAAITDELTQEAKLTEFKNRITKITDLNIKVLVDSTDYIMAGEDRVVKREFIHEYYTNCSAGVISAVNKRLEQLVEEGSLKPLDLTCSECSKEYKNALNFDYSSFFGLGS